jgi:hypothetical protein
MRMFYCLLYYGIILAGVYFVASSFCTYFHSIMHNDSVDGESRSSDAVNERNYFVAITVDYASFAFQAAKFVVKTVAQLIVNVME